MKNGIMIAGSILGFVIGQILVSSLGLATATIAGIALVIIGVVAAIYARR